MKVLHLAGRCMTTVHIATLLYQSSNISGSVAFSFPATSSTPRTFGRIGTSTLKVANSQDTDAAFSAFADALEEDELFADENEEESVPTWQESLEAFLDPMTPAAKKQVLLSDLVSANEDIRKDVQSAVRERKVCFALHVKYNVYINLSVEYLSILTNYFPDFFSWTAF